ncbi:MAG: hypothetical protein FD145_1060 [Candidatus Saganbacteria bacterium]|uniref:N-acetyltransferase domain-containing protein n=1 Tax=Candidatus Saganbacteria bacterium TaxID=2575572 RepID=A0A833NRS7_UNCSA|nr:MAG: hypothetical protein FD145_1060 [Candidatus Saganbacteria bacterium]
MLTFHPADKTDNKKILKILKDIDLFYSGHDMAGFWVAEKDRNIVGIVQVKNFKDYIFLSSLGVPAAEMNKGYGEFILSEIFKKFKNDIYIYTTIPDFFKKFGFLEISSLDFLPAKNAFECDDCHPEKCVAMVKKYGS